MAKKQKTYKHLNLISCHSADEFRLQCVLNSYKSMTISQNIEFVDEAVKYAADAVKNFVLDSSAEYDSCNSIYVDSIFSCRIPVGIMTLCDVINATNELDSLIKMTKFRNHIFDRYKTLSSVSYYEYIFVRILLMSICRKFPDMLRTRSNIWKDVFNRKNLYITKSDVKYFFDNCLKHVESDDSK